MSLKRGRCMPKCMPKYVNVCADVNVDATLGSCVVHLRAFPGCMCSSPQLCQQPSGSVNLGKISILQLTLQPFEGYVLPTFISQRVCKLINIFFSFHTLSLPSGKYLFPQKWAWANLPYSSICCQLPIKWAGTLKLIATPSSLLCLLFLSFRN